MHHTLPYWRLSGFYFFYFAFVGAFTPYWSLYLNSLEFSAFQIGVLMSLLQVSRIFSPSLWGWLADHTGKRVAVVQLAALLSLLFYLGAFLEGGFAWMFAVMLLMSLFWSASLPLVEAITLGHLGGSPAGYGRIRLWGSIGFIIAVVVLGYVLDYAPLTVLLWAVLGLKVGILLFSRFIPDASALPYLTDHVPVWHILRQPHVIALLAACFLMASAHGAYYTFYSIYLVEHGYSKAAVGWLWALGVVCEIIMFLLMPRLTARLGLRHLLLISFALAAFRFFIIGWWATLSVVVVLAQTLHAASFGSYHVAAVAVIHQYFRGRHQAKGQGLYISVSYGLGGTFGGIMSGYAWDALGASWAFTLCAACALLGFLVLLWQRQVATEPGVG